MSFLWIFASLANSLCRPPSKAYKGEPFVPIEAIPIDMFPSTKHCEVIFLYERLSSPSVRTEDPKTYNQDSKQETVASVTDSTTESKLQIVTTKKEATDQKPSEAVKLDSEAQEVAKIEVKEEPKSETLVEEANVQEVAKAKEEPKSRIPVPLPKNSTKAPPPESVTSTRKRTRGVDVNEPEIASPKEPVKEEPKASVSPQKKAKVEVPKPVASPSKKAKAETPVKTANEEASSSLRRSLRKPAPKH